MTYNASETSLESGTPVELYRFDIGGTLFLRTSADDDFTVSAPDPFQGVYTSTTITRNKVKQTSQRGQNGALEIKTLASDEIVTRYISIPPGQRAELTIIRIHRDDGDAETLTYWEGVLRTLAFEGEAREVVMRVDQTTAATNRQIPRFTFSATCNHTHYDGRCKVDKDSAAFKKDLVVSAQNGNVYTLTGAGAFGADFFERGYLEFNGDFRSILSQSGDDLTVILPFSSSPVGSTISARAGCKLRIATDCDTKFSNSLNFGGFPYIPTKNPFEGLD